MKHHKINKKTYQFGILSEKIAMIFLRLKGYRILAWRYKTRFGEIDIVAKKNREIVVVEVKARKKDGNFEEILRSRQINRMMVAAQCFVSKNPRFYDHNVRFDFIFVNKFFWPKHYKNFFS